MKDSRSCHTAYWKHPGNASSTADMNCQVPCPEINISQLVTKGITYGTSILWRHLLQLLQRFTKSPVDQQRLVHQDARTIEVSIDEYISRADISMQELAALPSLLVRYSVISNHRSVKSKGI